MNRTGPRYLIFLLLALLVALTSLPFIGQAFHIDDRLYLEVAEHALENPAFPYDYPLLFEGLRSPDGASHSHLPLTCYYLALAMLLTGSRQEWVFHLFFMLFPLIAAISFYSLARRYVKSAGTAVCLLLLSPVFLTLGHNLMTDVPMLAFWLLALSRFLKLLDGSGDRVDMALLAVALLCSAFLSMLTMGLVILLVSGLIARKFLPVHRSQGFFRRGEDRYPGEAYRPPAWLWGLVLLLPLLLWTAWYGRAWLHYDRLVLADTFLHMEQRETLDPALVGTKLLSFILNLGGIFFLPLFLWAGLKRKPEWLAGLAVLAGSIAAPFIFLPEWLPLHRLLFAVFLATGIMAFLEVLKKARELSVENLVLVFWFLGSLLICLLLVYAGSARYVLPALPPVILAITSKLENRFSQGRMPLKAALALALLASAYSFPLSWADYEFAESYRVNARELCARYRENGRRIWFAGEWGFRYYMTENGAGIISRDSTEARIGDIIIKPYIASPWVTRYDGNEYTRLLEQIPVRTRLPLRILDFSSHAGFYSSGWGLLPFSWTSGQHWEWFNVFQVTREFTGPEPGA